MANTVMLLLSSFFLLSSQWRERSADGEHQQEKDGARIAILDGQHQRYTAN